QMWADPEVTRFIGGAPSSDEVTWARLLRYVGHWALIGYGYWTIHDRATGRFVGEAGFADFHRDLVPSFDGMPECGWVLAKWAHGQGLATEAVRAIVAWGDIELPARPTVCLIDPAHAASMKVATKCGYRRLGERTYKGQPGVVFERPFRGGARA
ncbi:MAG: GNAT family N-acetyltransferase, partial [Polyangiales bacterium]